MADEFTPFATYRDVERRWHALTEAGRETATVLLEDATQIIMDTCPRWSQASDRTLASIACAMVIRKMTVGEERLGVTNAQQTAGSFSESFTYSNPMGDLYLTKAEKARLGRGRARAFHLDMSGNRAPPKVIPKAVRWKVPPVEFISGGGS